MTSTMRFDKWENSLGQAYNAIVQVKSVVLRNPAVMSSTTGFTTVTDGTTPMSISFTPKFANSIIKIDWTLQGVADGSNIVAWCAPYKDSVSLYTNTADGKLNGYHLGDAWKLTYGTSTDNNLLNTFSGFYYDSALNTAERVYSFRVKNRASSFYINRTQTDGANLDYSTRGISSLSIMEIAQ
jgi:hypothetical protein